MVTKLQIAELKFKHKQPDSRVLILYTTLPKVIPTTPEIWYNHHDCPQAIEYDKIAVISNLENHF